MRNALTAALLALALAIPSVASAGGKEIFLDQKCAKCHKVSTQGIAPTEEKDTIIDLAGSGGDHDVKWYAGWLKKETERDSKVKPGTKVKHKAMWKGTDADLETLANWLKGLTEKPK